MADGLGSDFLDSPALGGTSGSLPGELTTPAVSLGSPGTVSGGGTSSGGVGGWLSTTAGNIGNWVTNNPMSAIGALAGGGMLLSQMFGSQNDAEAATMKNIQQQATGAATTATMLQAPLTSGVLPPGAQAAVNQFKSGARASEISAYAKAGMSGSTGEADALQSVNQQAAAMQFNIADNLFKQAAGYAGLASTDYNDLLKDQMQQDQDFSNALSRFVSALAGGTSKSTSTTSAS
jgi:hypothetical protein